MRIDPKDVDRIAEDRSKIVGHFIATCEDPRLGVITLFAGRVFFEPGWDWDVVRVVNGRPQFFVKSYNPEAA